MEDRLEKLKEDIEFFINDYSIKDFDVCIEEVGSWEPSPYGGGNLRHKKGVEINLRV